MASGLDQVPPWLQVTPQFFTSAMESGANVGLQVAAQSQRAQELAAARAERESQDQERQAQEAERQREFDTSHLLNVQKVAQDAAQLQQQIAHQTALEAHQATQESRLLDYDRSRIGVEKQRADLADQQAAAPELWVPADETPGGAPGHWSLPGGKVSTPPASVMDPTALESRKRVGSSFTLPNGMEATWVGPNQIRLTPKSGEAKDLTPAQLLQFANQSMYSPNPTNRATAVAIQSALGQKAAEQLARPATVLAPAVPTPTVGAPTVAPAPVAPTVAPKVVGVLGQGTRDDPARPQTQEQMDSIPKGAIYRDPASGKLYRKK